MMSKKLLCLFYLLCCFGISVIAQQKQKFSIISFEQDPFDMSAKNPQYEKKDGSGSRYAIIKVTSNNENDNLKEFHFNFGNLRSSVEEHDGVLWVYVQRNAKMVTISRPGYVTINKYDLHTTIEAGKNYVMTLSSVGKVVQNQMLQFNVKPAESKAVIMIRKATETSLEELFGAIDNSGSVAKNIECGTYYYKVLSDNYHLTEGRIVLDDKSKTLVENVTLRPNFSSLTFKVDTDAEIYINGEKKGVREWSGILKSGNYQVECRQKNHRNSVQYVEISDNDNRTILLKNPEPIMGTLAVTSSPLGAIVSIDGKKLGQTPIKVQQLIGSHQVCLEKSDYKKENKIVDIREGEEVNLDIVMGRMAKMKINSNPVGAVLFINGENKGNTPYLGELASGDYTVKLVQNEYRTFEKNVHFDSSNPEMNISLSRQLQKKATFYSQISFQGGMANGVGANIGGYINNFNIEGSAMYYFCGEDIYFNTIGSANSTSHKESFSQFYSFGFRIGYGIIKSARLRFTPQVGFQSIYYSSENEASDSNYSMTIGARLEYALMPHVGVSLTPEGQFAVSKDEVSEKIIDVSSKVKGILMGANIRLGLYFNL